MSGVIRREEFLTASLDLGTTAIDLADYATTGLRIVTVGPSGIGKTNAGLLIAEQLAAQGWISVLMDPEGEIASLYPDTIAAEIRHGVPETTEAAFEEALRARRSPTLVVPVSNAAEFVTYARVLLRVVDEERKPVFLMVDEGQMFSASRKRKESIGEASDLVNDLGRTRPQARARRVLHGAPVFEFAAPLGVHEQEPDLRRPPGRSDGVVGARAAVPRLEDRLRRALGARAG